MSVEVKFIAFKYLYLYSILMYTDMRTTPLLSYINDVIETQIKFQSRDKKSELKL